VDPLTQGLLGASCGQALYGRALGRRAVVWGAAIGMTPDLDIVMNATGPMGEWLWHRGFTHALWFGPVIGPALGWLLWRWKGGRLRDWVGLAVVALFTHPFLDVFTSYGTQLLAPFSRQRFACDAVGIIDPAYSLMLGAAIAVGLWRGGDSKTARLAAWAGLGLSTAYLFLGLDAGGRHPGGTGERLPDAAPAAASARRGPGGSRGARGLAHGAGPRAHQLGALRGRPGAIRRRGP
jgi:inner membrane protein